MILTNTIDMVRTFIALFVLSVFSYEGQAQQAFYKSTDELRLFNHKRFKLVDASHFPVYSRQEHVVGSKARVTEVKYYFSKDERSPIMPLTINNLKHAFPHHREFHDLLDLQFRNSRELMRYDPYYSEYKLKSVFKKGVS
jgi:hypothetical protein